ncbi:MAG: lysophospholipase [Pseudobutyrivibrio sp.]|nr:lysophospholipase [Pseudobutyrivibrio sp.]
MTDTTYTFLSADNYSTIHCHRWIPDCEPVAVLQLVHGMVEYIERYEEFARFLNSKGYVVAGHDHIGHGHTAKNDDELGIMRGQHPSDIMVDDIYSHYELLEQEYPEIPHFILGHSMGSYMTRKFLSVKSDKLSRLSGAVIMGTGTEADSAINAGLAVIAVLSFFKGKDYRSTLVRDMTYSAPYKKYDCMGKDYSNSWLSKNVENVEKYYNDKYCTFTFSLNAYKGLVECTKFCNKTENIARIRKDMPLFVVSGQDDPVGGCGVGTTAAADKFKAAGVEDVTLKLYPDDRHEILNELDRQTVYNDIFNWLEAKRHSK